MEKQRKIGLVVAAALCGGFLVGPVATEARAPDCGPRGARTIKANSEGRVFSDAGALEVCRRRGREVFLAAGGEGVPWFPAVDLDGTTVGYATDNIGVTEARTALFAVSFARDRLDDLTVVSREFLVKIGSLQVTRRGALAWIECDAAEDATPGTPRPNCIRPGPGEKRVLMKFSTDEDTAAPRVADLGGKIDPSSLRLDRSKLSWREGAKTRATILR